MVALLLGRLALERRDAIARARMEVTVRVAPDEGGNQMRSGVSQGHPPQSRRTQRPSEAIRGNHRQSRRTPRPTEAISTYPMSEWIVAAGMCSPLGCFGPATRGRGAVVSVCMQGRGASRAVWLRRTDDAEEGIELARLDAPHLMKGPIRGRQRHSSAIGRNQDAPSGHQRQSARSRRDTTRTVSRGPVKSVKKALPASPCLNTLISPSHLNVSGYFAHRSSN